MKFLCVVPLVVVLVGCTTLRSIHPIATEETAVQESALTGLWVADDPQKKNAFLVVSPGDAANPWYQVRYGEGKDEILGIARLVRIGEFLWADVESADADKSAWDIPAHTFFRVEIKADTLTIRDLKSSDSFRERLKADGGPALIQVSDTDRGWLLTEKTPGLLALIRRYGNSKEALGSPEVFRREGAVRQ